MGSRLDNGRMDKQDFDTAYSVARGLIKRSKIKLSYETFSGIKPSLVGAAMTCALASIYEDDKLEDRMKGHYKRRYAHKLVTGSDWPGIDEIPF